MMPSTRRCSTAALLLLATLALSACSSTSKSTSASASSNAYADFKALIDSYYASWSFADGDAAAAVERASKYYAKDADLVFYDLTPMKYTGWADYKAGVMKSLFDTMASATIASTGDIKVERRGDVAWTSETFHGVAKPRSGGADTTIDGRHTAIWEFRNGQWLIVHEHLSVPQPV